MFVTRVVEIFGSGKENLGCGYIEHATAAATGRLQAEAVAAGEKNC